MRSIPPLLAALCIAVPAARGEAVELPLSEPLEAAKLTLELRDSEIDVVVDPDLDPALEIADLLDASTEGGFVLIEGQGREMTIRQPHGDDAVAPRLSVRIRLRPGASVLIKGENLTIGVEQRREEASEDADPGARGYDEAAAVTGAAWLKLDLRGSDVRLRDVRGATLTGEESRFSVEEGRGPIVATLSSSSLDVAGQRGQVRAKAERSDIRVTRLTGLLQVQMQGGSASISQANGPCDAQVDGANMLFQQFQGSLMARGSESRVEVRAGDDAQAVLNLNLERGDVVVDEFPGGVKVDMKGGSAALNRIGGRARVQASEGTTVTLDEIGDVAELDLKTNCRATIKKVAKGLKADVSESSLEAEEVVSLDVRVDRGTLRAAQVDYQVKVRASDSTLDLDLNGVQSQPDVELKGTSAARVVLKSPCQVVVDDEESVQAVRTSGCDVSSKRQQRSTPPRVVGQRLTQLNAKLEDGASLDVQGSP